MGLLVGFDFIDEKYKEANIRSKFVICRNEEVASMVIHNNDRKVLCIPLDRILYSEPQRLALILIKSLKKLLYIRRLSKGVSMLFQM